MDRRAPRRAPDGPPPYSLGVSQTAAIRLVTWGNAWLAGDAALDDVVDGVRGSDVSHTFAFPEPATGRASRPAQWSPPLTGPDVPDSPARDTPARPAAVAEALPIALAMGELRRRGATGLHLALPVAGDPLGLTGPPSTTSLVVDVGQAAVVDGAGIALVPEVVGRGVQWTAVPAAVPAAVASRAEAERAMSEELIAAARELATLDVARWNPGLPALLAGAGPAHRAEELPPNLDPRRSGLIARASRLRLALSLALAEDGGARTLAESRRRRELLEPLERAVRRAIVAACAPEPGRP